MCKVYALLFKSKYEQLRMQCKFVLFVKQVKYRFQGLGGAHNVCCIINWCQFRICISISSRYVPIKCISLEQCFAVASQKRFSSSATQDKARHRTRAGQGYLSDMCAMLVFLTGIQEPLFNSSSTRKDTKYSDVDPFISGSQQKFSIEQSVRTISNPCASFLCATTSLLWFLFCVHSAHMLAQAPPLAPCGRRLANCFSIV